MLLTGGSHPLISLEQANSVARLTSLSQEESFIEKLKNQQEDFVLPETCS